MLTSMHRFYNFQKTPYTIQFHSFQLCYLKPCTWLQIPFTDAVKWRDHRTSGEGWQLQRRMDVTKSTAHCPHLLSLRGDGIELVNEDDGGGVLLRLLKGFPQVALRLTSQFAHDLWAWDTQTMVARGEIFIISQQFYGTQSN